MACPLPVQRLAICMLVVVQDLDQARTLDDVVHHHRTFLATLDRQAGRGTHGDTAGAWKHLVFGINKVLDQVWSAWRRACPSGCAAPLLGP